MSTRLVSTSLKKILKIEQTLVLAVTCQFRIAFNFQEENLIFYHLCQWNMKGYYRQIPLVSKEQFLL